MDDDDMKVVINEEMNKIKLYCITYHILQEKKLLVLQVLFCDYCKQQLSYKQYLLFMILNKLFEQNDIICKDTFYPFFEDYVDNHKNILTKRLLNI